MRGVTKAAIALAALGYAGAAHAGGQHKSKTAGSEAATEMTTKAEASKEISGRVIQASPSKLFLEHMGAVLEFDIASDAQFSGVTSSRDLSEGQEVRASFTVENKTNNVVKRISLASEAGTPGATGTAPLPERPTPGLPGHPPGTETTPAPGEPGATPPKK